MDFHQTLYIKEFPATLKELQKVLAELKSPISVVEPDEKPIEEHSGLLSFYYQNPFFDNGKTIVKIKANFNINNRFKEPIYEKVSQYPRFITFSFGESDFIALKFVYLLCWPLARKYKALFRDNYFNVFLSPVELDVISTELNEPNRINTLNSVFNSFFPLPILDHLKPAVAEMRNLSIPESIKREFQPRDIRTLSNIPKLENYFNCQWCQWKFPEPRKDPFCNECKARCHVCGTLNSSCNKPGAMQFTHWQDYWIWVRTKHEKANSKLHWMYPY